jgi:ATP-binding protein involved in chromosome partitioning
MKIFTDFEPSKTDPLLPDLTRGVRANLADIRSVVAVVSAHGGVGKSALTVNLGAVFARNGQKTAIVDADLNAPSVREMLGMKTPRRLPLAEAIVPSAGPLGLRVVGVDSSFGSSAPVFSFNAETEPAIVENGTERLYGNYNHTLAQILAHTRFDPLNVLLIDVAPGLESCGRLLELAPSAGLLIISHSSHLAAQANERMLQFAALRKLSVLGIVENMVGFNCDGCHAVRPLMPHGALAGIARSAGVAILDRLPFDPRLAETSDRGMLFVREYPEAPLAKQIIALATLIERMATTPAVQPGFPR